MKHLFKDIIAEKSVEGILLYSLEGKVLTVEANNSGIMENIQSADFSSVIKDHVLQKMKEVELIFTRKKLYLKHLSEGVLCVIMDSSASMPMIRLNCDMIQLQLKQPSMKKGFKKLFKR
jgi:hypothetical protein